MTLNLSQNVWLMSSACYLIVLNLSAKYHNITSKNEVERQRHETQAKTFDLQVLPSAKHGLLMPSHIAYWVLNVSQV